MQKFLGMCVRMGMLVLVSGCIVSTSPNPSQTVFIKPGETIDLTVTSQGPTELVSDTWWDDHEGCEIHYLDEDSGETAEHTFTPTIEDIGNHRIQCEIDHYIYAPGGTLSLAKDLAIWTIVVRGVRFTPGTEVAATPGNSVTYTAKAYPDGTYQYTWYLDGVLVGQNSTFIFSPTLSQVGGHILEVRATGGSEPYTYTRHIQVPFASDRMPNDGIVHAIKPTSDGGYIVTGSYLSGYIPLLNAGQDDWYIVKFDTMGNVEWEKVYGDADNYEQGWAVEQTSDGGYILAGDGDTSNNVLKIDAQGAILWQNNYDGDWIKSIHQTLDGGYIMAGIIGENSEYVVIKTNDQGELVWQKSYDDVESLVDLQLTQDGGYIGVGDRYSVSSWVVVKIDAEGEVLWQKTFKDNDRARSIRCTADGGFVVVTKLGVTKLDPQGLVQWQRGSGEFQCIAQTSSGGYIVAGSSFGVSIPGHIEHFWRKDCYLVEMDADGTVLSEKIFGTPDPDEINAMVPATGGGFILAGTMGMSTNIMSESSEPVGRIFLFKLDDTGN